MNLRAVATADLNRILPGERIDIQAPDGATAQFSGMTGDISLAIDPQTGQYISGRTVHASIPLQQFEDAGIGTPVGSAQPPWLVTFDGATFAVRETAPDRTLGFITIFMELYG